MTLVGRIRERVLAQAVASNSAFYAVERSADERHAVQLASLNREWARITAQVPYYAELVSRAQAPACFESLEQFVDCIPPTTRDAIHERGSEMTCPSPPPDFHRMTGGSTAQPVQLPAWNSERTRITPDTWLGRGWYGIRPSSRLFMIWGHSHLLGTGLAGWWNACKRRLQDRLVGCHRFSAYDLAEAKLRDAARAMLAFHPNYVLGYSVALDRFARANVDQRDALRALGVKTVVGTAESFPWEDSRSRLAELFGCEVAMEYGCVEAGLLAHTHPSGSYRVFWRNYLLDIEPIAPGRGVVRVTSLYPRCFPLVRYELGDEVECKEGEDERVGLSEFSRVAGRCNDCVVLSDGAMIHSEVFSHAVRPCSEVHGYQVIQRDARLQLHCTSDRELPSSVIEQIRLRLGKTHPLLTEMEIRRVDRLKQTVAGKTRMVVRS